MDEDEMTQRFAALAKLLLWHIASVDTVVRGHMKLVEDFIDHDLQHLSETELMSPYGRQLQNFRDQLNRLVRSKEVHRRGDSA